MSSEGSSDQSCVHKGAGYDEVFLSSQDDLDTSYDERVLSTNSPSTEEDEDLDMDESKSDSDDKEDVVSAEPPIQSVIGPNGLSKFIMPPLWMIDDFNSSIKQKHSNTLREKY